MFVLHFRFVFCVSVFLFIYLFLFVVLRIDQLDNNFFFFCHCMFFSCVSVYVYVYVYMYWNVLFISICFLHTSSFSIFIYQFWMFSVWLKARLNCKAHSAESCWCFSSLLLLYFSPAKGKWIHIIFIHHDFDEGGSTHKKIISSHKVSFAIESRDSEGYDVYVCLRFSWNFFFFFFLYSCSHFKWVILSIEMCAHASRSKKLWNFYCFTFFLLNFHIVVVIEIIQFYEDWRKKHFQIYLFSISLLGYFITLVILFQCFHLFKSIL